MLPSHRFLHAVVLPFYFISHSLNLPLRLIIPVSYLLIKPFSTPLPHICPPSLFVWPWNLCLMSSVWVCACISDCICFIVFCEVEANDRVISDNVLAIITHGLSDETISTFFSSVRQFIRAQIHSDSWYQSPISSNTHMHTHLCSSHDFELPHEPLTSPSVEL